MAGNVHGESGKVSLITPWDSFALFVSHAMTVQWMVG